MYEQKLLIFDYNGLQLEVQGYFCEGEKGDYHHPDSPPTFEAHHMYLNGSDVEIMSMLNRETIDEIETECLTLLKEE